MQNKNIPVAMQDGLIQISFLIITVIANRRGLTDAAAVGVVEKFISFVFLVPSSMLSTVSALCAQNIGAGEEERHCLVPARPKHAARLDDDRAGA